MGAADPKPSRASLVTAFALIYVIWGSTFLAIRFAIETIPPFLMAGTRFIVAGGLLYGWTRLRGEPTPTRRQWRSAAIVGAALLVGGNGAVTWSEQRVPSGIAALLVALIPLWMVLLDWWRPGGARPTGGVFAGLALGLAGTALLVSAGGTDAAHIDRLGVVVLAVGSLSWAFGSLFARGADLPRSPLVADAAEMLAGGVILFGLAFATGEHRGFSLAAVTMRSSISLVYLITFGAIVGFSAYTFLIRSTTPTLVSTYAYVNPVVAVFLGWAFANEPVTTRTLAAAAVILAGVAMITISRAVRS
ncbi:MAG: drug/metabolite exporter YedA [Gemmatimonadaceae bacterium]